MIWDQRSADERGKPHAYLQLKRICAFRQVNEGEGVPVTSEASPWLRWLEMSAVSITSPYVTMTADMNSVRADEQFTGRGLHRRHHRGAVQFAPAGDHFAARVFTARWLYMVTFLQKCHLSLQGFSFLHLTPVQRRSSRTSNSRVINHAFTNMFRFLK